MSCPHCGHPTYDDQPLMLPFAALMKPGEHWVRLCRIADDITCKRTFTSEAVMEVQVKDGVITATAPVYSNYTDVDAVAVIDALAKAVLEKLPQA